MGKSAVIARDTEEARRQKFEQAVTAQHTMAVRTAEALRKVVLLSSVNEAKTELADFAKGQVDPQMQLVLIARDNFLEAEDSIGKLGFYKAMRDVFQHVDAKTMQVLDMAMKERHHREKLEALLRKTGGDEHTDEEVDEALKDAP